MPTSCRTPRVTDHQHEQPIWDPLDEALGEELAAGFMWMQQRTRADGVRIQAYKHRHTRRYLYLDDEGHAYEEAACGMLVPLRLDHAIEAALCTWWLLHGSTEAVRDAIIAAVARVHASMDGS